LVVGMAFEGGGRGRQIRIIYQIKHILINHICTHINFYWNYITLFTISKNKKKSIFRSVSSFCKIPFGPQKYPGDKNRQASHTKEKCKVMPFLVCDFTWNNPYFKS
jgi:hypothetical protein